MTQPIRPNLFIVGAPKCGTTAWVQYLSSHPEVYFPPRKEPNFFDTDFPRAGNVDQLENYLALFEGAAGAKIVGEASVRYLYSEEAAKNIRTFNPQSRIIILVRDQEDYLPSRHNQLMFNGIEDIQDFATAWRLSDNRRRIPRGCLDPRFLDYRAAGSFSAQVERYFAEFPDKQIRVLHFNNWVHDPRRTYVEIMNFLGVEDDGRREFPAVNAANHHGSPALLRFARRPPPFAAGLATAMKRATGRTSLGFADLVVSLGTRPGSGTRVHESLKEEIRTFFEEDNRRLARRIWSGSK